MLVLGALTVLGVDHFLWPTAYSRHPDFSPNVNYTIDVAGSGETTPILVPEADERSSMPLHSRLVS